MLRGAAPSVIEDKHRSTRRRRAFFDAPPYVCHISRAGEVGVDAEHASARTCCSVALRMHSLQFCDAAPYDADLGAASSVLQRYCASDSSRGADDENALRYFRNDARA